MVEKNKNTHVFTFDYEFSTFERKQWNEYFNFFYIAYHLWCHINFWEYSKYDRCVKNTLFKNFHFIFSFFFKLICLFQKLKYETFIYCLILFCLMVITQNFWFSNHIWFTNISTNKINWKVKIKNENTVFINF